MPSLQAIRGLGSHWVCETDSNVFWTARLLQRHYTAVSLKSRMSSLLVLHVGSRLVIVCVCHPQSVVVSIPSCKLQFLGCNQLSSWCG